MPPMFSSLTSYIWGDVADEAAAAEPNTAAVRRTPSPRRKCTLKTSSEDNEWVLVENSTGGLGSSVETGSMEDLLIEHPSMSVYQARGRQNSGDIDSSHSEDSEDVPPTIPTVATRGAHAARHPPRRPRAVAQRAGLSATAIGAIGARYRTRSITRSALSRNNQVVVSHQAGKHAARRGRIVQPGARCMRKC